MKTIRTTDSASSPSSGIGVDGDEAETAPSRARDPGGVVAASDLARRIETESDLHQGKASLHAIISAYPEIRVMLLAEAVRGIAAVAQVWNGKTSSYDEKVDFPTRQKWAAWLAGYADGLPAQTTLNINADAGPGSKINPDELLAASPAVRDAMRRALALADEKAAPKRTEKTVEPSAT